MTKVEQVGGNHYAAPYQHWDWVVATGLGYCEACATKYIARWRKKGGAVDLRKAQSYLRFLVTKIAEGHDIKPAHYRPGRSPASIDRFLGSSDIGTAEKGIIHEIDNWKSAEDLLLTASILSLMIDREEQREPAV